MFRAVMFSTILLVPTLAPAQTRDTTPVPRELALALIRNTLFSEPIAIHVGAAPKGFPTEVLPRFGVVIGGAEFAGERGRPGSQVVIMRTSISSDSARSLLNSQLARAGWQPPKPMPFGGSLVPVSVGNGPEFAFLCRNDQALLISSYDRSPELLISFSAAQETVCDERAMDRHLMRQEEDRIEMPTLAPPSGARSGGGGGGGSDDHQDMRIRIYSPLTPAMLNDHFAGQIERQGWELTGRANTPTTSVTMAAKRDGKGRALHGTLVTIRVRDGEQDVSFRVVVPKDRDR